MGIAAYNRGSRAIREQIDREIAARRIVKPKTEGLNLRFRCERCAGPLGVRLDRGCAWDRLNKRWIDACWSCRQAIIRDGHV